MASYSLNISGVSRSKGHSPVAGAAYRACERIEERTTGEIHDYTNKQGLLYEQIIAPQQVQVPEWTQDRAELWNQVEEIKKHPNLTLAREVKFALPHELSHSERAALATEYGQWIADRHQVMVDVCIHAPDVKNGGDERNYHAHIMMTAHQITEDGFKKTKSVTVNKGKPERFIAFDYGGERGSQETIAFRAKAAELSNQALAAADKRDRVTHLSYEAQEVEKLPTIHLGKDAIHLHRQGEAVRLIAINEKRIMTNQVNEHLNPQIRDKNRLNARRAANQNHYTLPYAVPDPLEAFTAASQPPETAKTDNVVSLASLIAEREQVHQQIHAEQERPEEKQDIPLEQDKQSLFNRILESAFSAARWLHDHTSELIQRNNHEEQEQVPKPACGGQIYGEAMQQQEQISQRQQL